MTPTGGGMGLVPVFVIQEALAIGLQVLREDSHAIDEIVGRDDVYTTPEWRREMRAALVNVIDPRSDECIEVHPSVPIPYGSARLPWVSVTEGAGGEDPSGATFGNLRDDIFEYRGPNQELWRTRTLGVVEDTTIEVGVWDHNPSRGHLLFAACRWALLQQTQRLYERGIQGISVRSGGVEVNADMEPRVTYCPMLSIQLRWLLRQSHRKRVPNRWSVISTTVRS